MRSLEQALIRDDLCPYKKRTLGLIYIEREDHVKIQGEDGHLSAKARGLRRN